MTCLLVRETVYSAGFMLVTLMSPVVGTVAGSYVVLIVALIVTALTGIIFSKLNLNGKVNPPKGTLIWLNV